MIKKFQLEAMAFQLEYYWAFIYCIRILVGVNQRLNTLLDIVKRHKEKEKNSVPT
jgi:hypothetical protein